MGMISRRVELGVATPIQTTFYTPNTETAVDSVAAVTVAVTHVNGTVILAAGTATTHGVTGTYSFTLPAQTTPATLVVTWTGDQTRTEYVDVIGRFIVDLSDIRGLDSLGDTVAYPTALLAEKRDAAEDLFEMCTGPWSLRYSLDLLDGDSTYRRNYMPVESSWVYEPNLSRRLVLNHKFPRQVLNVAVANPPGGPLVPDTPPTNWRTVTDGVTVNNSANIMSATAAFTSADIGLYVTVPSSESWIGLPNFTQISSVQSATQATLSNKLGASSSNVTLAFGGSGGASQQAYLSQNYFLYDSGEIERALIDMGWPRGVDNVLIEYTYGRVTNTTASGYASVQEMIPQELVNAFKVFVRHLILSTNSRLSPRATTVTNEGGTVNMGLAKDWVAPTGIPEVDAVLRRYDQRDVAIA